MTDSFTAHPITSIDSVPSPLWNELLARSNSDPLFSNREWQRLWWETYGGDFDQGELASVRIDDGSGQLACLASLYLQQVRRLPMMPLRSLQFVGGCWREPNVMLSEYLGPITATAHHSGALPTLLAGITELAWDEFVIELTPAFSAFATAVRAWSEDSGWYVRELDRATAYHVRLDEGFDAYTKALSGNARRRLLNNRSKLYRRGSVKVRQEQPADFLQAMKILNDLHSRRWQQPAFDTRRLGFLSELHARQSTQIEPVVSIIEVDGIPVSALYDIRTPARQYNLQMGFDPTFDHSLSLGLLHLGFAIEAAAQAGIPCYDFLGGAGQRANYKPRISNGQERLVTLHVVRKPQAIMFYRLRDYLGKRSPGSSESDRARAE